MGSRRLQRTCALSPDRHRASASVRRLLKDALGDYILGRSQLRSLRTGGAGDVSLRFPSLPVTPRAVRRGDGPAVDLLVIVGRDCGCARLP
jgi:hypothetical protein